MHRHLLPPGDALDVACGRGRHALWLADRDGASPRSIVMPDALRELGADARRRGLSIEAESIDLETERRHVADRAPLT